MGNINIPLYIHKPPPPPLTTSVKNPPRALLTMLLGSIECATTLRMYTVPTLYSNNLALFVSLNFRRKTYEFSAVRVPPIVSLSSVLFSATRGVFFFPAAFLTQKVQLDDATVKFEIWDTAGQERYRSLAPMYYRGAAAAIVVYDVTNKASN